MNILLIMPKVDIGYQDWPVPPVGIAYVSAALKQAGFHVFHLNLNLEEDDYFEALRKSIEDHNIQLVGTGGLVVNYHAVRKIVDQVKAVNPKLITWAGGSLMTFSAMAVMKGIKNLDIGMLGEGEVTACELASVLEKGGDIDSLDGIRGLIVRKISGEIVLNEPREEIEDLDTLPYPDYEGFRYFDMIREFWESDKSGIISAPLTTSRSCPFCCTFCSKSGGTKYRQRSLKSIFEELEFLVERYHVNRILLNDELFANDHERIMEFCKRIQEFGVKWFVSLRVSRHITEELLKIMKDSGCVQILYGLESGDDSILRSMRKGITAAEIERVVRITAEAGFQVRGNFIFGDTNETMETCKTTLDFVEKNAKYFTSVAFSPILLFPGSYLYSKAIMDGVIQDETDFIEKECPVTNVSQMTDDEYVYMLNVLLPTAKAKQMALFEKNSIYDFKADKENRCYSFRKKCDVCMEESEYYVTPTENIMRNEQYICPKCGASMMTSVLGEYSRLLSLSLQDIVKKHHLAFWGTGQNLVVLNEMLDGMKKIGGGYILLDTNSMKIGKKGLNGKTIHHPDDMKELGIDFVIETTSGRHFEIINKIEKDYPDIKYRLSIFEVPLREWEKEIK